MASYIHGNVVVKERYDDRPIQREAKRKEVKRKAIPSSEKLLYLFSILIIVVVSGILLSRVAEGYEMSYKIQEIQSQMESLSEENSTLQLEIDKLQAPERIMDIAKNQLGMVQSESQIHLNQPAEPTETASR